MFITYCVYPISTKLCFDFPESKVQKVPLGDAKLPTLSNKMCNQSTPKMSSKSEGNISIKLRPPL